MVHCKHAWRDYLRTMHGALQPFFTSSSVSALGTDEVVQLEVRADPRPPGAPEHPSNLNLRALLDLPRSMNRPARWVILGEPGAGKSTMARSLVWRLAGESNSSPIPLVQSLTRAVRDGRHPFEIAEGDLRQALGPSAVGLAQLLFENANNPDDAPVWLLLDGFDEVPAERVGQGKPSANPSRLTGYRNRKSAWLRGAGSRGLRPLRYPCGPRPSGAAVRPSSLWAIPWTA